MMILPNVERPESWPGAAKKVKNIAALEIRMFKFVKNGL